ncbi:hypothetical protein [Arthrobacter psychrochitiniphilus]|nr:hypothetical protein [Arthrobacter psychrochitiniphilus]NYG19134.1 hypothetical protein [Arthrobacter psychrochitiniphilus]
MEFELLPLPMIYAGALFFDTHHVSDILHAWTEWRSTLTAAATTSVALMQMPPLPGVPEPIAGKFTIAVRYVFAGKPDDGARWLAPLRSVAPMLKDAVGPMPSSMIGLVHSDPEDALPATEGSALLATFDAAAAQTLLNVAGPDSDSPQLMVEIRQFGGLLSQEPEIPSALCHRDAEFGLSTVAAAPPPDLPALATHAAGEREHMSPWAHGGTLPNFASSEGQAGFATSYTAPVLERLSGLAEHFDPSHVFRMGQVPMR